MAEPNHGLLWAGDPKQGWATAAGGPHCLLPIGLGSRSYQMCPAVQVPGRFGSQNSPMHKLDSTKGGTSLGQAGWQCHPAIPAPASLPLTCCAQDGVGRPWLPFRGQLLSPASSQLGQTCSSCTGLLQPRELWHGCWHGAKAEVPAPAGKSTAGPGSVASEPLNAALLNGWSRGAAGWAPVASLGKSQQAPSGAAPV